MYSGEKPRSVVYKKIVYNLQQCNCNSPIRGDLLCKPASPSFDCFSPPPTSNCLRQSEMDTASSSAVPQRCKNVATIALNQLDFSHQRPDSPIWMNLGVISNPKIPVQIYANLCIYTREKINMCSFPPTIGLIQLDSV